MRVQDDVEALGALPIFSGCRPRELRRIAALGERHRIPAGELLMLERYRGAQVHIVVEGSARVTRAHEVIGDAGPGAVIGELGVMNGIDRTATVVAETPMRLLTFDEGGFQQLLRDHPRVAERIRGQAAAHASATTD